MYYPYANSLFTQLSEIQLRGHLVASPLARGPTAGVVMPCVCTAVGRNVMWFV